MKQKPSAYLKKAIRRSEKDKREGRVSPVFDTFEEMMRWMNDPDAKYQNGEWANPELRK